MIRTALIIASCSFFTACMTAQDKLVLQEAKDIMSVGPRKALVEEKAPEAAPASKVSDASEEKDGKKVEKSVVR